MNRVMYSVHLTYIENTEKIEAVYAYWKLFFDNYTKRDLKQKITTLTTGESGLEIPVNNGALCVFLFFIWGVLLS